MKKIISMILPFLVCLSLTVTVYAEEGGDAGTGGENMSSANPYFTVTYTGSIPNETLSFEVPENDDNPTLETISVADQEITQQVTQVPIEMPASYSAAGEYVYVIRQLTEDNSPDYNYDSQPIVFHVLVGYDYDNSLTVLATGPGLSGGAKKTGFTNTLKSDNPSTGSLSVTNLVQGRAADRGKFFDINVTFTVPDGQTVPDIINYKIRTAEGTVTSETEVGGNGKTMTVALKLKHGSTAIFDDLPDGISYTIESVKKEGFNDPVIESESGTLTAGQTASATVKNSASVSVGSGVLFENTGTLIILAVAVVGLLLLLIRKKRI
jgi:pilin isopeptide linkage protein